MSNEFRDTQIINVEITKSKANNSMVVFHLTELGQDKIKKLFIVKNEKFVDKMNKALNKDFQSVDEVIAELKIAPPIGQVVSTLFAPDSFVNEKNETIKYMKPVAIYNKQRPKQELQPVNDGDLPF